MCVAGTTYRGNWDGWYGPSGRAEEYSYDVYKVMSSDAGRALARLGRSLTPAVVRTLRSQAEVTCTYPRSSRSECKPLQSPCLFNVRNDPCEQNNLATMWVLSIGHHVSWHVLIVCICNQSPCLAISFCCFCPYLLDGFWSENLFRCTMLSFSWAVNMSSLELPYVRVFPDISSFSGLKILSGRIFLIWQNVWVFLQMIVYGYSL